MHTSINIQSKNCKLILHFILILYITKIQAQEPVPIPYSSNVKINYLRSWDAVAPETNPNTLTTRTLRDVKQVTLYLDGLGRPLQTVAKQGSLNSYNPTNSPTFVPTVVDMISPVVYDEFGRERIKYLPCASTATDATKSNGLFKLNPFQQQVAFYNTQLNGQAGETNVGPNSLNWAYSQTNFETSPLNSAQEEFAPGSSWVGTSGQTLEDNRHSIKAKYFVNTGTDAVRIWTVTNAPVSYVFGSYSTPSDASGVYPVGQLYKTIVVNEHNKQLIEFKDKEGKIILKKVQLTAAADNGSGSSHAGWLCTYYIYDDLNNLRCVIQPQGVETLDVANWASATFVGMYAEQCFRYEYDARNRMIIKKVPGAGQVDMVYDAEDRLVMVQDARLKATNQWLVTKYDALNRPIETGLWTNATDAATHRTAATTSTSYPTTSGTYEEHTKTFYDNYDWLAANGNPFSSNRYTFDDPLFLTASNTTYPYAQPLTQSFNVKGMVTGTKTKVLGASQYMFGINYYDEKGRILQTQANNVTGGIIVTTTQYNFSNQPLVNYHLMGNNNPGATQAQGVRTKYEYDDLGRMLTAKKEIFTPNGVGNTGEKLVLQNEYDALGQLKKKKLAPNFNAGAGLENLTYDYNIRGWMLGMNKAYISSQGQSGTTRFGFELGYDKLSNQSARNFSASQFNGNITGMVWKSDGDDVRRKYDFTYDAANRLMQGLFEQDNAVSSWNNTTMNYTLKMGDGINANSAYDYNGNIKAMTQFGWKLGVAGTVPLDNMRYTYILNTNKLKSVKDFNNDALTKLGDFKTNTSHPQAATKTALTTSSTQAQFDAITDYTYDVNGNLTLDNNKTISGITYNHLNLPSVITVTGKGTIAYTYDATGNKLKKVVTETGQPVKTTLYIAGAVYENDVLQFLGHEEGRIRWKPENNTFNFDYFLKDHLGNVRMVLTEEQQQDQYPAATMEGTYSASAPEVASMINYEKKFYAVNNTYVVNSSTMPGWTTGKDYANNNGNPPYNLSYPAGTAPAATATSAKVYKLNATTNKTGLGMVLKVMAGDKIDIHGKSYYQSATTYNNANSTLLSLADLIGAFIGSPDNAGFIGKGISSPTMQTINTGQIPATFFRGNDNTSSGIPKAYINYIFFDEQFKYAGGSFSRAGSSGTVKNHWFSDAQLQNIPVPKNGYLYVYVSNESNDNVFFDNLQVFHTRGPILEETHYYPFGLTMAGISSKALTFGSPENKRKFNKGSELQNKEFSDGSGLEMYTTPLRSLDPQLGRWWQIDSKPDYAQSLYSAMGNNPISFNDPFGDTTRIGESRNQTLTSANGKTYSGAALTKKLVKEMEKIGGVKLRVNKRTGEIEFKGNNDKAKYSKTGREEVMKMVTGNGQIKIDFDVNRPSQTDGDNIYLNPTQIDKLTNGASSDLNSMTTSYGMVTLHEYNHTPVGGGQFHDQYMRFGTIDQPDVIGNRIRNEMSEATGTNWGQRESYFSMSVNGSSYIPFSTSSKIQLQRANTYQGTWQGYLIHSPPTSSVVVIPPL